MAKINLLSWRAERRAERQKEFYVTLALSALAGVVVTVAFWFFTNGQIAGQNQRNAFLRDKLSGVSVQLAQIKELDKQREQLLTRKNVIEELQASRSQMVHLFDSLVHTIPDGVVLTSLKQDGNVLSLEGRAQSNTRVSDYLRNLEQSGWISKPNLSLIEAKDAGSSKPSTSNAVNSLPYVFSLTVELSNPADSKPGSTPTAKGVAVR